MLEEQDGQQWRRGPRGAVEGALEAGRISEAEETLVLFGEGGAGLPEPGGRGRRGRTAEGREGEGRPGLDSPPAAAHASPATGR